MYSQREKLRFCVIVNSVLLIGIVSMVSIFADPNNSYLQIGPNDTLVVISVKIDTMNKYLGLLFGLAIVEITRVIIEEIGMPIIGFAVYDPERKIINEFGKNELNIYANAMYTMSSVRERLMVLVSISQIDIAFFALIVGQITSIYTIRMLLNEKKFVETKYAKIRQSDEVIDELV